VLWYTGHAGPVQKRLDDFIFILILVGGTVFPAVPRPSTVPVPAISQAAVVSAFIAFIVLWMVIGWIVAFTCRIVATIRQKS
jgi:hypothetical protein